MHLAIAKLCPFFYNFGCEVDEIRKHKGATLNAVKTPLNKFPSRDILDHDMQ